jgi:hypothetical protein
MSPAVRIPARIETGARTTTALSIVLPVLITARYHGCKSSMCNFDTTVNRRRFRKPGPIDSQSRESEHDRIMIAITLQLVRMLRDFLQVATRRLMAMEGFCPPGGRSRIGKRTRDESEE